MLELEIGQLVRYRSSPEVAPQYGWIGKVVKTRSFNEYLVTWYTYPAFKKCTPEADQIHESKLVAIPEDEHILLSLQGFES